MAKIFSAPTEFEVPQLDFGNINAYEPAWEKYEADLKASCIRRNPTEHVGKVIRFPVADGYAMYMIAAMKPVQLIHLEYLDSYHFEYAHRLTATDIKEKISQDKAMNEIFGRN